MALDLDFWSVQRLALEDWVGYGISREKSLLPDLQAPDIRLVAGGIRIFGFHSTVCDLSFLSRCAWDSIGWRVLP